MRHLHLSASRITTATSLTTTPAIRQAGDSEIRGANRAADRQLPKARSNDCFLFLGETQRLVAANCGPSLARNAPFGTTNQELDLPSLADENQAKRCLSIAGNREIRRGKNDLLCE